MFVSNCRRIYSLSDAMLESQKQYIDEQVQPNF